MIRGSMPPTILWNVGMRSVRTLMPCSGPKTTKEWLDILLERDIWCSQVNTFDEMVKDPQIKHNNMIIEIDHPKAGKVRTTGFPVWFSDTPQKIYKPAPLLNEDAKDILKEFCGYSEDKINQFITEME